MEIKPLYIGCGLTDEIGCVYFLIFVEKKLPFSKRITPATTFLIHVFYNTMKKPNELQLLSGIDWMVRVSYLCFYCDRLCDPEWVIVTLSLCRSHQSPSVNKSQAGPVSMCVKTGALWSTFTLHIPVFVVFTGNADHQ